MMSESFFLMAEMETGQSLGKDIKGLVPVQHAHPNVFWANPEMPPTSGQNLVVLQEFPAVLYASFAL